MSFEFASPTSHYSSHLESLFETYPNSKASIEEEINTKTPDFTLTNKIRFLNTGIRKLKIPLTEYEISTRRGLRLIYIIAKNKIWLITIYSKSEFNRGREINRLIKAGWDAIDFDH